MHEASKLKTKPSSLRLVDNNHITFGRAFHQNANILYDFIEKVKPILASLFLGYDMKKISMATFSIEGGKKEVDSIEREVVKKAGKFSGRSCGPQYGETAYRLTFAICYLRV